MSYRDLEIWQLAREMSIEIHRMTLNNLPKFEMINRFLAAVERKHQSPK